MKKKSKGLLLFAMLCSCILVSLSGCNCKGSDNLSDPSTATADHYSEDIWNENTLPYKDLFREGDGQISFVMDASILLDGNYNETIFSGVQQYSYASGSTYSYYRAKTNRPEDTLAAMEEALSNKQCRLVVVAGTSFNAAIGKVMTEHPEICFLSIGGHPQSEGGDNLPLPPNVHCVTFKEEEAGYLAGYMTVMDGYRSLGFIGGEASEGVVSYGSGYLQGINDAAKELSCTSDIQVRYWYSGIYQPADEIYERAVEWYQEDCQVIFACGGSLYEAVLLAAENNDGKIIGVDVNQNTLSDAVLTSAVIGLDRAVVVALDDFFASKHWSEEFAGKESAYGVDNYCATLPLDPWRFNQVSLQDVDTLMGNMRSGDFVSAAAPNQLPLSIAPTYYQDGLKDASSHVWSYHWEKKETVSEETEAEDALSDEDRTGGDFPFDNASSLSYGENAYVYYDAATNEIVYYLHFPEIPSSDNANIYLFARGIWEDEELLSGEPVSSVFKDYNMEFRLPYKEDNLYLQYVPALLVNGSYEPVAHGKYITNPEDLAYNRTPYPDIPSKKGLLIDPGMFGTEKTNGLNLSRGIYNIPLSLILGETSDPNRPTIEYEYEGKTYRFNTANVNAYDALFSLTTSAGMYMTAIVLNDWNEVYPELIHPLAKERTKSSLYYAFNTTDAEGVQTQKAVFNFLAERYTCGQYGMVYDWVLANEINQNRVWNYMDTTDIDYYAESFEDSFRIFYNAIRSHYSDAKVYFSLDHDWNDNNGNNGKFFNGRELLYKINEYATEGGNYDWGIAIHPYPDPLTRVNYWKDDYDMTEDARVLTIMNLSSLTSILDKNEFRQRDGSVRSAAITELGFSSYYGENLQAAAFAYCYLIIDENPYIDSFQMNRQTDSILEMKNKLALGIYNTDGSPKLMRDVFATIDAANPEDMPDLTFMLNLLEADSVEEALSWARP